MAAEKGDINETIVMYVKTKKKKQEKQDFTNLLSLDRNSSHSHVASSAFPENSFSCPDLCQYYTH